MNSRDERQRLVGDWIRRCFGQDVATFRPERALRVVEEAVELAQASGVYPDAIAAVVAMVYQKEPGNPRQELGGVGVTLLAYASVIDESVDDLEAAEVRRILAKSPEHFRERQNAKAAANAGAFVGTSERS